MNAFDLHIAYVSWGSDGKRRPILIHSQAGDIVSVYAITSQYSGKSESVRRHYYAIEDWAASGLAKSSYIDVGSIYEISTEYIGTSPIGALSGRDKTQLSQFIANLEESI